MYFTCALGEVHPSRGCIVRLEYWAKYNPSKGVLSPLANCSVTLFIVYVVIGSSYNIDEPDTCSTTIILKTVT
jgi:hypothetical protein